MQILLEIMKNLRKYWKRSKTEERKENCFIHGVKRLKNASFEVISGASVHVEEKEKISRARECMEPGNVTKIFFHLIWSKIINIRDLLYIGPMIRLYLIMTFLRSLTSNGLLSSLLASSRNSWMCSSKLRRSGPEHNIF